MKKYLTVLFAILLCVNLSFAQSQRSAKFQISIGGGLNVPIGVFDDQYSLGMNMLLGLDFFLSKHFCLFLNSGFDSFKYDTSGVPSNVYKQEGGDLSLYSIFVGAKGVIPTKIKLTIYALGGVGFCTQKSSDFQIWGREPGYEYWQTTYNKFREGNFLAVTAGCGLEYTIVKMLGLFVEIRVVNVFTTEQGKPDDWPFLSPEVYQDHPDVLFFPLRLGINIKI